MIKKRFKQVRIFRDEIIYVHDYNVNLKNREIYLLPRLDVEDGEIEYGMAMQFIKNLDFLSNQNHLNILIKMGTPGGDWNSGIAIYDAVVLSQVPTTILAYAHARSMSSIILQAADCRVLMPDTDFMIHFGSMSDEGHTLGFISGAEFSKKANQRMLQIYAKRCINGPFFQSYYKNPTEDKVIRYLDKMMKEKGDWWLTAEEAVQYGFCDGILGTKGFETIEKIRTSKKFSW